MRKKCLLDTNFIIYAIRHKIRIIEEIREKFNAEPETISSVIDELKRTIEKKGKLGKEAKLGLDLIERNKINVIETNGKTDDVLASKSKEYIIATNDKELRERIKSLGGKAIYIRKKAFIE